MDEIYLPSEQDRETIKRFLELAEKDIGREPHDEQGPTSHPDEMYVVVPPCGESIPARQGAVPGQQTCCLFKLVLQGGTNSGVSGFEYELVPVIQPGTGLNVQQTVYNIYDEAISARLPPDERYLHVKRDKSGKWLVVPPTQFLGADATSTTSPVDDQNTYRQKCESTCKWTWNGTYWTTDGCTTSTTTSTSSTSSTTTTTLACLCLAVSGTTTTTTTTMCSGCVYPNFCGTAVGQCYFSSCTPYALPLSPDSTIGLETLSSCSASTTTTFACDCNTTSTPGPCCSPPCGGPQFNGGFYCLWNWNGLDWVNAYDNCESCEPPPDDADTCCGYIQPCGWWTLPLNTGKGGFGGGGGGDRGGGGGSCNPEIYYCGPMNYCCWCWNPMTSQWNQIGGLDCLDPIEIGPVFCEGAECFRHGGWACNPPSVIPGGGGPGGGDGGTTSPPCNIGGGGYDPRCPSGFYTATAAWMPCWTPPISVHFNDPSCYCTGLCGPQGPGLSSTTSTTTTTSGDETTTSTSTTVNPNFFCAYCYTTSTSTTQPPASGTCLWKCSNPGGSWSLISNDCVCPGSSCLCFAPFNECLAACQVQISSCVASTTTTAG